MNYNKDNIYMSKTGGAKHSKTLPLAKVKKTDKKDDFSGHKVSNAKNMIDIDSIYKFSDLYFKQQKIMYSHLYNSFNKLLDEDIPNFLKNDKTPFYEKVTRDKVYKYYFKYEDIAIKPPYIDIDDEIMFPRHARLRNLTYESKILATITQIQEVTDIATGEKTLNIVGNPESEYTVTTMPIMLKSKYCPLNLKKGYDKSECDHDPGGYFIVNGSEKVVMSLERMIDNRPLVFIKKEASSINHTIQVNSKSHTSDLMQIINIRIKKDNSITIRVPIFAEVPVFIVMRALGIESDKDIIDYCVYDKNDIDMINTIRMSLENSKPEKSNHKIVTQTDAINYLINKIKVVKKYNEIDKDIRQQERRMHLLQLLKDNFFPHIEGGFIEKAFYIGNMINRLLHCYLGRIKPDDRDSFINKRVDLPGTLILELFKQYYKKMLNECNKYFKKRNPDDVGPLNIITQIKGNIIQQGIKTALLTGTWGKKKGVAQMLQRLSYLQTIASLRRINSPTGDASTNKLTGPRHLDPSILPCLCFIETSEGAKVGLSKSLSLIGSVTVLKNVQIDICKAIIKPKVKNIQDIRPTDIGKYTRVSINGFIVGLTDTPRKLYHELKQMKFTGTLDPYVGIAHDIRNEIECREIKINCDSGRIFNPSIRVVDNVCMLNKDIIDLISIDDKESATKITSWNQFMIKHPGVIEYLDPDERYNSVIAMYPSEVEEMRMRGIESIEDIKKMSTSDLKNVVNRYDKTTYIKYTHCEIHPSLLLGVVVSNIPFADCNQGPRNIFQYSQARQAMGIYATNWRDRLDISYILYHPQRPIVTTRSMKYVGTEHIPGGENCVVAITCYSGYNEEDSNIMSKAAIERGLFRSTSVKKYQTIIQKNQATSQDDLFTKPDRSLVTGMRHGTYDKLNEQGYAPEETVLDNDDILMGKVSPIQPVGNSKKIYKDSSEYYKSHIPGVVDKVYTDLYNNEGYGMRKVRVRSERIPMIGDKFCSRMGQKGTNGIQLRTSDMMVSQVGIQPDICMNTNALPSRMTVGQLIECLTGKVAALEGIEIDGSTFSSFNLDDIKKRMKELGYEENGFETMRNGMTGKKLQRSIFVGPTYYQRLKHMVADKIHARARGPHTVLTRQPPEGRSRDGGLRFGEMERDCMISHGLALFLKERLLEASDVYDCYVCDKCGLFAQRMMRKDNKDYPTKKDIYFCQACKNYTDISKIRIPYAFKLLIQELLAMNVCPRIRTQKHAYE